MERLLPLWHVERPKRLEEMYRLPIDPAQLFSGCILHSVVHAVFTCGTPEFAHVVSWESFNYSIQDIEGTNGTISFAEQGCVGAFFDIHSPRSPYTNGANYEIERLLEGIPEQLRYVALNETLEYMYNVGPEPVITASFWQMNGYLESQDTWDQIIRHGGHIIENQALLPFKEAIVHWQRDCGLSDFLIGLAKDITLRRNANGAAELTPVELDTLLREADSTEALDLCIDKLAQVGVSVPAKRG